MIYELVYTSAPQGLRAGTFGYCTVARSAGMSERLAKELEKISAYDFQAGSGPAPVVYSFRRLTVAEQEFAVLSCVRACEKSDYSGRTNYVAHHLACDNETVDQLLSAQPLTPAEILLHYPWRTEWSEPPRELEEVVQLSAHGTEGDFHSAATWARFRQRPEDATLVLAPGCEARPSYLAGCPDFGETPQRLLLHLFHESLLCLSPWRGQYGDQGIFENGFPMPPSAWWKIGFTTCRQQNDKISDFSWIGLLSTESGGRVQSRQIIDFSNPESWETPDESTLPVQAARDANQLLRSSLDVNEAQKARGDLDRRVAEFVSGCEEAMKLADRARQKFTEDERGLKKHMFAMDDAQNAIDDALSDKRHLGKVLRAVASSFTALNEFNSVAVTQKRERPRENWTWIYALLAKAKNWKKTYSETVQFLGRCGPGGLEKQQVHQLKVKWEGLASLREEARQLAEYWRSMEGVGSHFHSLVADLEKWIEAAGECHAKAAKWQEQLASDKARAQEIVVEMDNIGAPTAQDCADLVRELCPVAPAAADQTPGFVSTRHGASPTSSRSTQTKCPMWRDKRILIPALVCTLGGMVATAWIVFKNTKPPHQYFGIAPSSPMPIAKAASTGTDPAPNWMYIVSDGGLVPDKLLMAINTAYLQVSTLPRKLGGKAELGGARALKYSRTASGDVQLISVEKKPRPMIEFAKNTLTMKRETGDESLRDYLGQDSPQDVPGYELAIGGNEQSGSMFIIKEGHLRGKGGLFTGTNNSQLVISHDAGIQQAYLRDEVAKALQPFTRAGESHAVSFYLTFLDAPKFKGIKTHGTESVGDPQKARLEFELLQVESIKSTESQPEKLQAQIDTIKDKCKELRNALEGLDAWAKAKFTGFTEPRNYRPIVKQSIEKLYNTDQNYLNLVTQFVNCDESELQGKVNNLITWMNAHKKGEAPDSAPILDFKKLASNPQDLSKIDTCRSISLELSKLEDEFDRKQQWLRLLNGQPLIGTYRFTAKFDHNPTGDIVLLEWNEK